MSNERSKPLPFVDHLPKPVRYLCGTLGFALISACGQGAPQEGEKPSSGSQSTAVENLLDLPFPPDPNMRIQQGWLYESGRLHHGIDYILGQLDNSATWKSFPVLAAADGQACLNPPKREGNAVFIEHVLNGITFRTLYGHLKDGSSPNIPDCAGKNRKPIKKGEKVGDAGSTGVKDEKGVFQPTWLHLHFNVNNVNDRSTDPYGLDQKRDAYPDPNFTNGKECGRNALFARCFQKQAQGAIIAAPGPTQRTQTYRIQSATVVPTTRPQEVRGPLTLEQEAQQYALQERFISGLNRTDGAMGKTTSSGGFSYIEKRITERREGFLKVFWRVEGYSHITNAGLVWGSAFGESEIRNIEVVIAQNNQLSEAQKLNGLEWQGNLKVNYSTRFRGRVFLSPLANIASSLADLPPWQERGWISNDIRLDAAKRGGRWQRSTPLPPWITSLDEISNLSLVAHHALNNKCALGCPYFSVEQGAPRRDYPPIVIY